MSTLGERIKQIRKENKDGALNQAEFGARIGVQQSTVAGWESNAREPSIALIKVICEKFGYSEYWLRTGEGSPEPQPKSENEEAIRYMENLMAGADEWYREKLISLMRSAPMPVIAAWCKEVIRIGRELEKGPPEDPK